MVKKGIEEEGKTLNLSVGLCSSLQLWSGALDSNRKKIFVSEITFLGTGDGLSQREGKELYLPERACSRATAPKM